MSFDYKPDILLDITPNGNLLSLVKGLPVAEAVEKLVFWHKVRLSKVEQGVRDLVVASIQHSIKQGKPIEVLNAYGGFKAHRSRSAPHVNWSEAFHLSYFCSWLVTICEVYPPGIHLEYSGDSYIAGVVDNYKMEDVSIYLNEFDNLVALFNSRTPQSFTITTKNLDAFYNVDELEKEIKKRVTAQQDTQKQEELIGKYISRARNNFVLNGREDFSGISEAEKDSIIRESILKTYTFYEIDFEQRGEYFENKIPVCNLVNFPEVYLVRSISGTDKNFWMTDGVLERKHDVYKPRIFMPDNEHLNGMDIYKVESEFTKASPALQEIGVIKD